jgi:hypothetical protein
MRLALLLLIAACAAHAQPLTVRTRSTTAPEMGTIHFLELSQDGHSYTMIPPGADWRSQLDTSTARLRFFAPERAVAVSLRFTTNATREVMASADTLRQHAAPDLEEPRKLAEFDVFSGDAAGKAAEFAYTLKGQPMRCRLAAVPTPGGTVDFTLLASAEEFPNAERAFNAMINTFRRISRTAAEMAAEKQVAARKTKISGD